MGASAEVHPVDIMFAMKKKTKSLLTAFFKLCGFQIAFARTENSPLPMWEHDGAFNSIYEKMVEFSFISKQGAYNLYQLIQHSLSLAGDVAEVGVYRGGTATLIAETFRRTSIKKQIHLFDTFEGMPAVAEGIDLHHAGDFGSTSVDEVQRRFSGNEFVHLHKGYFPATAMPIEKDKFCFVHVDVDIYQSVKDCCDFFYPRLEMGGILISDDYGHPGCPGAKKAFDEFFRDKIETPIYLTTGQCFIIKK